MNTLENLISLFFQGHCTQEEAEVVLKYLRENPAAAEKYTGKQEWDQTEFSRITLPEERSKKMLSRIRSETYRRPSVRIFRQNWAVAACLTLVLATGFLIYKSTENIAGGRLQAVSDTGWNTLTNSADGTIDVVLKDGTSVILSARSKISFQVPFPSDKRNVKLSGKAFFKVSKDPTRPFTVYSGDISTTVLGTAFTIDAFAANSTISIKLHEGRVMVKHLRSSGEDFKEYYLFPNQELVYDKSSRGVLIQAFADRLLIGDKPANARRLPGRQTGVAITFNREPVVRVFEKLESSYRVTLDYPKDGLKDYYFTGQFGTTDSLERVLRIIGQTNKLDISKTRSGYKITKKH